MLTRVSIENYRGFKSYRMEDLSRVNLLVGKNNSGKTALLEGIQFFTSGGDPAVLAEVAHRRGEVILKRQEQSMSLSVDIAHFFHGHTLTPDTSLTFGGETGYPDLSIKLFVNNGRPESAESRTPRSSSSGLFLKISGPQRRERDEPRFPISRDGGVDFELPFRSRRMGLPRRTGRPQVRFVGPDSLDATDMAAMWDEVTLTGKEADVATAMRVLEPELESVHFLTGMLAMGVFPSRSGIVVGVKGQETRLPLGSMGDGMRRLMALATALAFTRDGCLFVDEIDTGLHYTVMPDMWKLIITKALASNAQVFATTHSWDCIEGLSLLCQREQDLLCQVAVHKIDRALQHSVPFSGESLVRMLKSDIDPR